MIIHRAEERGIWIKSDLWIDKWINPDEIPLSDNDPIFSV